MYGIINQAVQGLVTEKFGEDIWLKVKEKSNIKVDSFLSNESYSDSITYELAQAAADVLNISLSEVLMTFGEYWVLGTGQRNYGPLLKTGGGTLKDFLVNLPNFHSRVMLMYPKITPPEFKISHIEERSVNLHYYSQREGLADFVVGIMHGLGKLFDTMVTVELIQSRSEGFDHEILCIRW